ncbi:MAG: putative ABC transporter ATP-binding protein YxlF [Alphaproteobacteria bacterium MarineAlpha9_Bin4]|nr:multidrug ABC transporter ATP-binding protein [Pelagibacterales bacterium]PPR25929.1 MAG: putative ABC transporter ATP-binding protein YxlF [Alphaproteobacteria bacterium MarineAlpha9_Bin4]
MQQMIKIKSLCKSFGSFSAVNNITFDLNKGDILGFLGPNGAGKTTTMRMLTGFLKPSSGDVIINNRNMKDNPEICKSFIGYVPEGAPLYEEMTAIDFLKFTAKIRKIRKENLEKTLENVINLLNLKKILFKKIDTLSKGFKRRVGLAQAIIHNPEILILDEPTDGLDPNQKNEVRSLIRKLGKEKAIIISTHILEEVNAICNRAMIISDGRLLLDDKPNEILKKSTSYKSIYIAIEEKNSFDLKNEILNKKISKDVSVRNNQCVIKTNNSKSVKSNLDEFIKKNKFTLKHYSIGKGSLEEVFRRLTSDE